MFLLLFSQDLYIYNYFTVVYGRKDLYIGIQDLDILIGK